MRARLAELPLLVVLLGATGVLALVPAIHAVATDDHEVARGFFYASLILMVLTAMLGIATAGYSPRDSGRSHLAALVGAYAVLPLAMTLPMVEAVPDTSLSNAWFEMISAFTTTGATAYAPDRLSPSVHLWRALVGWFGGFIILLAAYAILAPLNLGGVEVATGRVPGRSAPGLAQLGRAGDAADRLTRFAWRILPVYAGLTLALWLGLLVMGEQGIDALIHAMGTLSSSGISGQVALAEGSAGRLGEVLIFLFLVFAMTRRALPGMHADRVPLRADPEMRLAALVVSGVTALLFLRHFFIAEGSAGEDAGTVLSALWGILFTAASFLSTSGYVSGDWEAARLWSGADTSGLVLMGLAIFGGGIATTAGGVKLLRVYALLRHGERELDRVIHPSSVGKGGAEARRISLDGAQIAWVFFMLFGISIAVVVALLTLLGQAFEPALVLAIAALTTTGPLADHGGSAAVAFGLLSDPVKLVLGLAMVVGRLETLALLALVLPGGGRR
jgi:trk system potassium uptake protein TrkH